MTHDLTAAGYERTKAKLAGVEQRLAAVKARTDLPAGLREQSIRSHREMIQLYSREIKLYEARHGISPELVQRDE